MVSQSNEFFHFFFPIFLLFCLRWHTACCKIFIFKMIINVITSYMYIHQNTPNFFKPVCLLQFQSQMSQNFMIHIVPIVKTKRYETSKLESTCLIDLKTFCIMSRCTWSRILNGTESVYVASIYKWDMMVMIMTNIVKFKPPNPCKFIQQNACPYQ